MKLNSNYNQKTPKTYAKAKNDYASRQSRGYEANDVRQSYGQMLNRNAIPSNYGMRQPTSATPLYLRRENCTGPSSISRLANYNHMKAKYSGNAFAPKSNLLGASGLGARRGAAKAGK